MWNQVRAALAFLALIVPLGAVWLLARLWLKPKAPVLGEVVSFLLLVGIVGLMEHGWSWWYGLWRVKR